MSAKTQAKAAKRRARKQQPAGRPAYHFHSKYRGLSAEQIEERVRGRVEPKQPSLPLGRPRASAPARPEEVVTLVERAEGLIREGTLRAAVVDALRAGRGSMTIEALSAALKQNARPVVSKLIQKGWLRRGA